MAYVRTKKIKGHTYYYLVEVIHDGKKVRQKVLCYLGPAGGSAGATSNGPSRGRSAAERTRQLAREKSALEATYFFAVRMLDIQVRHNKDWRGNSSGMDKADRGAIEYVRLTPDPPAFVAAHELGHVIDLTLFNRAADAQHPHGQDMLWEEEHPNDIRYEFETLAMACNPTEAIERHQVKQALKQPNWRHLYNLAEDRSLRKHFDDYLSTPPEGFANTVALMMIDPEKARRLAPRAVEMISRRMQEHEDLCALLTIVTPSDRNS